jgi:hypothetical protein
VKALLQTATQCARVDNKNANAYDNCLRSILLADFQRTRVASQRNASCCSSCNPALRIARPEDVRAAEAALPPPLPCPQKEKPLVARAAGDPDVLSATADALLKLVCDALPPRTLDDVMASRVPARPHFCRLLVRANYLTQATLQSELCRVMGEQLGREVFEVAGSILMRYIDRDLPVSSKVARRAASPGPHAQQRAGEAEEEQETLFSMLTSMFHRAFTPEIGEDEEEEEEAGQEET